MLPVLIYEQNEELRARLLDAFDALPNGPSNVKISISTGSQNSMRRALEAEQGICLVILGIGPASADACVQLGSIAMQRNRDNYTLYLVHDPDDLDLLLMSCMRPAGILIQPFKDQKITNSLQRIITDYAALSGNDAPEDFLVLEVEGSTYRIPYGQILYLEALDKKINIYTSRQCITVRKSLSSLVDGLPDQFVRCHRAYVVNSDFVNQVNYTDMILQLQNNDVLPIARSQRTAIKQMFDRRAQA